MGTQILEEILAGNDAGLAPLTVEQYHQMIASGILEGSQRSNSSMDCSSSRTAGTGRKADECGPQARDHCVSIGQTLENAVGPGQIFVRAQSPITLPPGNEPEPDVAIVTGVPDDYSNQHPGPTEVVAVMEVADSSLRRDRITKRQIYASEGIGTYWIVDLSTDQIEVYTQPEIQQGQYAQRQTFAPGEVISLALPDGRVVVIPVSDVLP